MPIGEALNLDLPTQDDSLSVWLAKIKTALEAVEEVLESQIDSGSLDITTPMSFGGSYAYNLIRIQLVEALVAPTDLGSLYIDDAGELHIVTPSGDVAITNGGQLNIAAVNGIGGDYGSGNPAIVYYDDISGTYWFYEDDNGPVWADIGVDDLILNGVNGSVRVGVADDIVGPAELYFKSFPSSGKKLLTYDAATSGLEEASAIDGNYTFNDDVSVGGTFGAVDINATGDILALGSITAPEINGGDFNHTTAFYKMLSLHNGYSDPSNATGHTGTVVFNNAGVNFAGTPAYPHLEATGLSNHGAISTADWEQNAELRAGDRLLSVVIKGTKIDTTATYLSVLLWQNGTYTSLAVTGGVNTSSGAFTLTGVVDAPHTLADDEMIIVYIQMGTVGDLIHQVKVSWDHPEA